MSDRICLDGCRELPAAICVRGAAVPASVLWRRVCVDWQRRSPVWLQSHPRSSHAAESSGADGEAGRKGSQAEPLKGSVSSLEGDPQQMDYATERKTLPVFAVKGVCGRRFCVVMSLTTICDVVGESFTAVILGPRGPHLQRNNGIKEFAM